MAIPKIKLYGLDQSYDPSNDSDIQSVNDDEIYPFVEKSLDLSKFEQLVGVTYRDLMAGKSKSGFEIEILMQNNGTAESPSYDRFKSAKTCCDGWRLDDIKVLISLDDGATWSSQVPEKYYRLNFTTSPIMDDETNPTWKRQARYVQVELGKWIYSGSGDEATFIPPPVNDNPVNKIKLQYSLFSDDITSTLGSGETLSLQRGKIYDGTLLGRASTSTSGVPSATRDENGIFLKPEGNLGYKIKTYPCRQKVAYLGDPPAGALWKKDLSISSTGRINITDCDSWIIAQTDDRRPRLFQSITVTSGGTSYTSYLELEQGVQYSSTLVTDVNGKFNVIFQLSEDYYNFSYGVYLFPTELFVRYNEEDDLIEDIFTPNYLELEAQSGSWSKKSGTDTGDLTAGAYSMGKRVYATALTSDLDPDGDSPALSWSGDTFTIQLPAGAYDGIVNNIIAWEDGEIIYSKGNLPTETPVCTRKYKTPSLSTSAFSMTLVDSSASKPSSILFSYVEGKSLSNQMVLNQDTSEYENPWAVGWRICAYEKTKIANRFVSSFRNWVSDHLNNSPDVFIGYTRYDGSTTNSVGINHVSSGFSILHRNGSITFAEPVAQADFDDVKNWPPSGLSIDYTNLNIEEMRLYTSMVNSKFAYYDGLQDVNNGILRKIAVGANAFSYSLIDDPTYVTLGNPVYSGDSDAIAKTTLKNKRWIIRNDSKMPTMFYKENKHLPSPVNCEESPAVEWTSDKVLNSKFLQINLSSYRSVFMENSIAPPPVDGTEINGQVKTRSGNISWSSSYLLQTAALDAPASGSKIFPVTCPFTWSSAEGRWIKGAAKLEVYIPSTDSTVDSSKTYYSYSSSTYFYSKILSPSGNPSSSGYLEKSEMSFSSRAFDPEKSIAQIFEAREGIVYSTASVCPYNISFLCCENGLMATARTK